MINGNGMDFSSGGAIRLEWDEPIDRYGGQVDAQGKPISDLQYHIYCDDGSGMAKVFQANEKQFIPIDNTENLDEEQRPKSAQFDYRGSACPGLSPFRDYRCKVTASNSVYLKKMSYKRSLFKGVVYDTNIKAFDNSQ